MLQRLIIKNLAIIEHLDIEFSSGLNILTGETGAGKSIILGSLNLILGAKADDNIIRKGEDSSFVCARFVFPTEQIMVKREIGTKNRYFINDKSVTLNTLKNITRTFIDIQSQHEHYTLLDAETQMNMLDEFSGLGKDLAMYTEIYKAWQELLSEKQKVQQDNTDKSQIIELYQFQIQEIEKANLKEEEEEELKKEFLILSNSEKLHNLISIACNDIYAAEESVLKKLKTSKDALLEITKLDNSMQDTVKIISSCLASLQDITVDLRKYKENIIFDPKRLDDVISRIDCLDRMKKKYGKTISEIANYKNELLEKLKKIVHRDEEIENLNQKIAEKEQELNYYADRMSKKRRETAKNLSSVIENELKELGLQSPRFLIQINERPLYSRGKDSIGFMFSANKGEDVKPLSGFASGGELSRVMLCLKKVFTENDRIDTIVFDEVDTNIGGRIGEIVGKKIFDISRKRQVISITHLPQVASFADKHFFVSKSMVKGRTQTQIKSLEEQEKIEEIARMMRGEKFTQISIEHAKELINMAQRIKR
jgi:DNA repair protein RecN (Recombination protein N)